MKNYLSLLFFIISSLAYAQQTNLNERLGFGKDEKLLIIHADDIGLAHSENVATIKAMTEGVVNSTSIMMPCAWSTQVGELLEDHADLDVGVHITLTNEWFNYKWAPLAPQSDVPGMIGEDGYMHAGCAELAANASPDEVEKEMRAQIDAALRLGIKPTHLDSHMGCVFFGRPEYIARFIKLGLEYDIPTMLNRQVSELMDANPDVFKGIDKDMLIFIDDIATISPKEYDELGMETYYSNYLNDLEAGLNIMLIHLAYDNEEMKALTVRHDYWHSPWRQGDYDFFTSEKASELIAKNNIRLITWREIGEILAKE